MSRKKLRTPYLGQANGKLPSKGIQLSGCMVGYLGHLLTIGLGVERGFGEEDGMLLGGDAELVVEGVVPDLLHVVPVGHDTVLDRVLQRKDALNTHNFS